MPAPLPARGHEPLADDDTACRALYTVADGLTAHGFDTRSPTWERSYHLDTTNVRGAVCELNLTQDGKAIWEYRQCHSCHNRGHQPGHPERGNVRVADDGTVRWECSSRDPADDTAGLQPSDIAETIAKALAGQDA